MFMCGQKQNKNTNRWRSLSQISILVTPGYHGSHWSQQCPKGELCCGTALCHYISFWSPYPISPAVCEADQSEHLWPTPCLLTKSKTAAITGTQWRGKNQSPKSFQQLYLSQNFLRCVPLFPASFSLLMMDLSSQVFTESLANIHLCQCSLFSLETVIMCCSFRLIGELH